MGRFHIMTISIEKGQFTALKELKIRARYKSLSEMARVAIRDFLDKELIFEEKIKCYNGDKEIIIIDGKCFKVIEK